MSLGGTARAVPALLKIGFAEAVAYRAELIVWVLSTTMPLIMLALWTAVAREAPVGRFGPAEFTAYFLATFIVRQLTGSWASWELNYEIRQGTLAVRLLRPIQPILTFALENIAVLPMRVIVSLPVAALWLAWVGAAHLPRDPVLWAIWVAAMAGSWLITFFVGVSIGCLAFFLESSVKVMELWLVLFFVFSGYMIPLELFPRGLQLAAAWLPFRYQIGFPVEVLTSGHDRAAALVILGQQWLYVLALCGLVALLWRAGLRRFAAYGG